MEDEMDYDYPDPCDLCTPFRKCDCHASRSAEENFPMMVKKKESRFQLWPDNFVIFVNGWAISLGLGYHHHCDHRDITKASVMSRGISESLPQTQTAEVCVWLEGTVHHLQLGIYEASAGFVPVDEILNLVQKLRETDPCVESFTSLESWWKETL